jgi:colanic acid biosynthesis glycosyl transferase WcaI
LLLGIPIALLAKLKRSSTIFHVQDLQPDAAVDMGMLKSGLLTSVLYSLESLTYKLVDRVSTISHSMQKKIVGKGVHKNKVFLFTNWAHDHLVTPMSRMTRFSRELELDDKFIVLYSGNMGVKQGLSTVLEAAHLLREDSSIAFLLVGDGGKRAALQEQAARLQLTNTSFLPLQPIERLSELLATADVGLIPQIRSANDNMLPSKLPNLMASQRPIIVAASHESELGHVIRLAQCGVRIEPEQPRQLADAITQLKSQHEDRQRMGLNGRSYMEAHFSRNIVLSDFAATVQSLQRDTC